MMNAKKYYFIYKTINLINNKFYIGMHVTNNLKDGYLGSGKYLIKSINKHGKENFRREILIFAINREVLIELERAIVTEELFMDPMCMNLMIGGKGGSSPDRMTADGRKRISEFHKGKSYRQGCKHSVESKKKISDMRSGKYGGENNPFYGKTHTKETLEKISKVHKGKIISEEHKQKIRDYQQNHPEEYTNTINKIKETKIKNGTNKHSEETKNKIKLANIGKIVSKESREKMSKARKGLISGSKNPKARRVECIETGQMFGCIKEILELYNISGFIFRKLLKQNIYRYI